MEVSSEEDGSVSVRMNSEAVNTAQCISQMYRKSLRLTSEQIVRVRSTSSSSVCVTEFSLGQVEDRQFGNTLKIEVDMLSTVFFSSHV